MDVAGQVLELAGRMVANRGQASMGLDVGVAEEVAAGDGRCSRVEGVEDAAVVEVPVARGGDDAA